MKVKQAIEVPGYAGRGIAVDAGTTIRVTDLEGAQIGDVFALSREDVSEFLCTARTRALNLRLFPAVGEAFFTNRYRPILTFMKDDSPGTHDSLFASCDPGLHALFGAEGGHPSCHENFLSAAMELGLSLSDVPAPVNFFQNTPVDPDGSLRAECAPTKPGDFVEIRAELDLFFILTACSVDLGPEINGGQSTAMRIELF